MHPGSKTDSSREVSLYVYTVVKPASVYICMRVISTSWLLFLCCVYRSLPLIPFNNPAYLLCSRLKQISIKA